MAEYKNEETTYDKNTFFIFREKLREKFPYPLALKFCKIIVQTCC